MAALEQTEGFMLVRSCLDLAAVGGSGQGNHRNRMQWSGEDRASDRNRQAKTGGLGFAAQRAIARRRAICEVPSPSMSLREPEFESREKS